MDDRLTAAQVVLQSQLIHPDWTVDEHLSFLDEEGYVVPPLGGSRKLIVEQWMRDNIRMGRVDDPGDEFWYSRFKGK